jgi:TolB-like protein/tetratricopeptide (TPR) repeat protein
MGRNAAVGEPGGPPRLRMGIGAVDAFGLGTRRDIAGGAKLAMMLARAGEVVAAASARDQLTDALDADIEDLGECRPSGGQAAMRLYRIAPPRADPVIAPARPLARLMPAVAVIPPVARMAAPEHEVLGEVLADELIHALARSERLDVISRLSTTVFRQRAAAVGEIGTSLGADYVLTGVYRTASPHVVIDLELSEARSERIVWSERFRDSIAGVLGSEQELVNRAAADVCTAISVQELQRARSYPLRSLDSYTLMMSAITLMHRMSVRDFQLAREMLQTVIDRDPAQPLPQAWMALWYVVRLQQGWPDDPLANGPRAMDYAQRALEIDPECSLALAMDGLAQAQIAKRHDLALDRYQRAVASNRCHSIAWLLKGTLHAFMGEGQLAVECAERASRLSPLDPHRYFYDSLAATAHLAARRYREALTLAQRSLRANRRHASTLRATAIAQWQLGLADDARRTVEDLLRLDPGFTISGYLARIPASPYWTGREWSAALRAAGVPP